MAEDRRLSAEELKEFTAMLGKMTTEERAQWLQEFKGTVTPEDYEKLRGFPEFLESEKPSAEEREIKPEQEETPEKPVEEYKPIEEQQAKAETEPVKQLEITPLRRVLLDIYRSIIDKTQELNDALAEKKVGEAVMMSVAKGRFDPEDPDILAIRDSKRPRDTLKKVLAAMEERVKVLRSIHTSDDPETALGEAVVQNRLSEEEYAAIWKKIRDQEIASIQQSAVEEMDFILYDLERTEDEAWKATREEREQAKRLKAALLGELSEKKKAKKPRKLPEAILEEPVKIEDPIEKLAREIRENPAKLRELYEKGELSREDVKEIQARLTLLEKQEKRRQILLAKIESAKTLRANIYGLFQEKKTVSIADLRKLREKLLEVQAMWEETEIPKTPAVRKDKTAAQAETLTAPTIKDRLEDAALAFALDELIETEFLDIARGEIAPSRTGIAYRLMRVRDMLGRHPEKRPSQLLKSAVEQGLIGRSTAEFIEKNAKETLKVSA